MFGREPKRAPANPMGRVGEDHAARHLAKHGYTILERNVRVGRYELDLIALDGDTIVFVEVKTRNASDLAHAEDNVTRDKRRRLLAAAEAYIARRDPDGERYYRFDVVAITVDPAGARPPRVVVYRDAFRADER